MCERLCSGWRGYRNLVQVLLALGIVLLWFYQAQAQRAGDTAEVIDLRTAITQVAKKAIPAVAHIEVTEKQEVANPYLPFQNDPFFRHFFGLPEMPKKFKREVMGLGSGILMDAQGHI
jgi:S1-C subfamily serine protease